MSYAEKYLIASDLDGTFFGEKSSILPVNLDAIARFQAEGGMFTLATGRSFSVLKYAFPGLKDIVSGPAIVGGGSCLYDFKTDTILDKRDLDKDLAKRIIRETREKFPDAGYRICTDKGFLTDHLTDYLAKYDQRKYKDILTVDDLDNHLDRIWFKFTYSVPPEDKPPLAAHLMSYMPQVFVSGSSSTLTETLAANASKGKQVENLKRLYPGRKIVCVGDFDNDLDMLEAADIAACPANANDRVKRISQFHLCDHKEGCIADLIEKLKTLN